MSTRPGSSRTVGIVKQCAAYERGKRRCVHCRRKLRAPHTDGGKDTCTASIDHWNGDGKDHRPENLLPSCRRCNEVRPFSDLWEAHLRRFKTTPEEAEDRARAQLAEPLDLRAGRALAEQWHHERFGVIQACQQRYRDRQAGRLPPVGAFPFGEGAACG